MSEMLKSYFSNFSASICRICMDTESDIMMPLYERNVLSDYDVSFSEMLNFCSNVHAQVDDELPAYICKNCKDKLIIAYLLKQQAERSDGLFRNTNGITKSKIIFKNVVELKSELKNLDIENAYYARNEPSVDLTDIVEKGGEIGNVTINKIPHYNDNNWDNDVYYDDEDYIPPNEMQHKKRKKYPNRTYAINGDKTSKTVNLQGLNDLVEKKLRRKLEFFTVKIPVATSKPKEQCPICGLLSGNIEKHMKCHDAKPAEPIKELCPICGLMCLKIKAHIAKHEGKATLECDQCSKKFTSKCAIQDHMAKHTGIKNKLCKICGAAYYNIKGLARHQKTHEERKYKCTHCAKAFIERSILKRHMWTHTGYKPFECEHCSRPFSSREILRTHMRSHTGEKPYTCEVCNVAFSYKVNLNNHTLKVHGVNIRYKQIHNITAQVLNGEYEAGDIPQYPVFLKE